jgi:hypothetical protein
LHIVSGVGQHIVEWIRHDSNQSKVTKSRGTETQGGRQTSCM